MRLRVRLGARTERLEVENDASYSQVKNILAAQLGLAPADVRLSLNKTDELDASEGEQLRSAGVKGGDLLFLLGAAAGRAVLPQPALSSSQPSADQRQSDSADPAGPMDTDAAAAGPAAAAQSSRSPAPAESAADIFARVLATSGATHGPLRCAVHAAALEAGLAPTWQGSEGEGRFGLPAAAAPAAALRLSYRLTHPSRAESAECELAMIQLGSFLAVTARPAAGGAFSASLSSSRHAAGGSPAALANERELWLQLKDRVLGPALRRLRLALGLPEPCGLTGLPVELSERVLSRLQARDLAALRCCSRALRAQAAADSLWRPLVEAEFPHRLQPADPDWARRRSWAAVYRDLHVERETARREAEEARRLARRRFGFPALFPHTGGPFGQRTPVGGYRQIGGDYDRNPAGSYGFGQPFFGSGGVSGPRFGGGFGGSFGGSNYRF